MVDCISNNCIYNYAMRSRTPSTSPAAVNIPAPVPSAEPRGCTNLRVRQLMRRLDSHYDVELAKAGLKTTQYSLLSHIVKLEPVAPGALARSMKLQASTLTRNLQPLIAAGWVELSAGADARSRSIRSTAEGREKRQQAQRRWKQVQLAVNAALGVDRVVALHALVDECLLLLDAADVGEDGPDAEGLPDGN
jgi:DNA-binding MarR family transcriptional regulator